MGRWADRRGSAPAREDGPGVTAPHGSGAPCPAGRRVRSAPRGLSPLCESSAPRGRSTHPARWLQAHMLCVGLRVSHPASSFPRELLLAPRDRPRFLPRVHRADSRPRGAFPGADRQRPDRMERRRDTHRPRHDGLACPKGPPASGGRGLDMRPDVFGCSDSLRVVGRCRAGLVSGCPRKLTGHGRTRYGCRPGLDPQDRGWAGAD